MPFLTVVGTTCTHHRDTAVELITTFVDEDNLVSAVASFDDHYLNGDDVLDMAVGACYIDGRHPPPMPWPQGNKSQSRA